MLFGLNDLFKRLVSTKSKYKEVNGQRMDEISFIVTACVEGLYAEKFCTIHIYKGKFVFHGGYINPSAQTFKLVMKVSLAKIKSTVFV